MLSNITWGKVNVGQYYICQYSSYCSVCSYIYVVVTERGENVNMALYYI